MYNLCFMVSIYLKIIYIDSKLNYQKIFHPICMLVTSATLGFTLYKKSNGLNPFGTCSIAKVSNYSILFGLCTIIVLIVFASYILYKANKVLPNNTSKLASLKRNFVNFYSTYLRMIIILWGAALMAFMAQNVTSVGNSFRAKNKNYDPSNPECSSEFYEDYTEIDTSQIIFNIGKLGNCGKLLIPILLFMIRMRDPLIKQNVFSNFRNLEKTFNVFTTITKGGDPSNAANE